MFSTKPIVCDAGPTSNQHWRGCGVCWDDGRLEVGPFQSTGRRPHNRSTIQDGPALYMKVTDLSFRYSQLQ